MIIDINLQEDEDTSIGKESCEKTTIREETSPNEKEIASSCLGRSQRVRRPSSILRDPSFVCNVSIESEILEPSTLKEVLLSSSRAK